MKDNKTAIIAIVIGVVAIGLHFFHEKEAKEFKLGYVKNKVLLEEYLGVKEGVAKYESLTEVLSANVDTLRIEFENAVNQYRFEYEKLSETERELTEKMLQIKERDLQSYKLAIDKQIEEEDEKLTSQVLTQIDTYVVEYAKEAGYDYIFGASDAGSLFFADEKHDVTPEVLKGLNDYYEGKVD